MKTVPLNEVKDALSCYLHRVEDEEIVITRHGKPAGLLIGFASDDDWFDYRLEHDPRFLARVERARHSLRAGQGVRLEDADLDEGSAPRSHVQKCHHLHLFRRGRCVEVTISPARAVMNSLRLRRMSV